MLSQSPTDEKITPEYEDAFVTTQYLIYYEGGSLSGREWNRSYLNLGVTRFAEVTTVTGLDSTGDGRAVATIDWDDDGWTDVILKNRTGPRHEQDRAHVSLEVDRQIGCLPVSHGSRRTAPAGALAPGRPGSVDDPHPIHERESLGNLLVPASHRELDLGIGSEAPELRKGGQRH